MNPAGIGDLVGAVIRLLMRIVGCWILWHQAPHWVFWVVFLLYPLEPSIAERRTR